MLTGTREWAGETVNIQLGCEHNCRYCYARHNMVNRFHKCTAEQWVKPKIDKQKVDVSYGLFPVVNINGRYNVMFPSTHDITPYNLSDCLIVLDKLVNAGNHVLIVTKPHLECISLICQAFEGNDKIHFRFTIGSADDDVLKFWEPGAPLFKERLSSLIKAAEYCFSVSVSCEPFLDPWILQIYDEVAPYLSGGDFWIGRLNGLSYRVDTKSITEEQRNRFIRPLWKLEEDWFLAAIYNLMKNRPGVRFKDTFMDSIRELQTERGS